VVDFLATRRAAEVAADLRDAHGCGRWASQAVVVLGTGTTLLVHRGSKMTSSSAAEGLLWPQRADPLEDSQRGFIGLLAASSRTGSLVARWVSAR
jgi:hypothetical protein